MAPAILFADITAAVLGYLRPIVAVTTVKDVPNPRPAKFLRAFRTGGPRDSMVTETAQLTLEAWATTSAEAFDLAATARAALQAMAGTIQGGIVIYKVDEFAGPVDFPDPTSQQARYTWTVSVQARGTD